MNKNALFQAAAYIAMSVSSAFAVNYDVYLAAGQSNMDGRGNTSDLTGSLSPYAATQNDVKIWYDNPVAAAAYTPSWVSLKPGYSVPPGSTGAVPGTTFGPEISFGRAMQNAAAPGHTVAIIKVAEGGTNLSSDWNPAATSGKKLFSLLISDTQAAVAALGGAGNTVTIRGMIWHQGESDSSSSQSTYVTELTQFINAVRTNLSIPSLPFVVGQIELDHHGTNIPNAQEIVGTSAGFYTGLARSNGLPLGDGTTHFDAAGQITLGQRFATSLLTLVPEPTSLSLIGMAAIPLLRRRRTVDTVD